MRFKSYGFWTALAGALTMLANAITKYFGITIENGMINDIIMAIAGVLVVFGVVSMPKKSEKEEDKTFEESQETIQQDEESSQEEQSKDNNKQEYSEYDKKQEHNEKADKDKC